MTPISLSALNPPMPGPVAGARIDDHERTLTSVDGHALRRNNAHEPIVHRALQRAAIDDELSLVIEHIRHSFGHMFAVLIAALAHDVPEQHCALGRVDRVVHGRDRTARTCRVKAVPVVAAFDCCSFHVHLRAQPQLRVMPMSPGMPPGKSTICAFSL